MSEKRFETSIELVEEIRVSGGVVAQPRLLESAIK